MTGKIDLRPLLAPQSIAVVGASERQGAPGRRLLECLQKIGFAGRIAPIHPSNETVLGLKCYRSPQEVPWRIDAVAFCIDGAGVPAALQAAAEKGARAGVIFGGMGSRDGGATSPRGRITAIAREHGMALCGPNCMGVFSPASKSSLYLQVMLDPAPVLGDVGLVTHSGSVAIGMLGDCRRFGFSHVISSGDEAVVTLGDYIDYLVDDPATRVIAAFVESVRDMARFTAALDRASSAGKPVVILKIGRSTHAREAAVGHTGAVVGDGRVFSALLARHHAIEVTSLEEMTEVLAACQSHRRPRGPRVGVVTASGGQVEMILDEVNPALFSLPPLPADAAAEVSKTIGPISGPGNPLDSWGNGDYTKNLPAGLDCLANQPAIDAVVLVSDTNDGQPMTPTRYTDILQAASERSDKPFYFMNTRFGLMRMETVHKFKGTGVGMLTGLRQGLGAIGRLGQWAQRQSQPAVGIQTPVAAGSTLEAALRQGRKIISEVDAKRILREAEIDVVPERVVRSLADATGAAATLGYPVVLKVVSDDIPHRSEHGLIAVGLHSESELHAAWSKLDQALAGLGVAAGAVDRLVQPMIGGGLEVLIGIGRDAETGPYVAFGAGGVLVELLGEVDVRPLPLCEGDAQQMVARSRLARLLAGYRGRPASDVPALVRTIERIAAFAHAEQERVREIDVNPVIVRPVGQGCVVVDALIVPS
ncbi:MAG TPA: acetate--CoA ligase family protein [Alphaproteobacteria bacterium]|nr:acetate--CoA ligase family protein [Alphaproteobacteria bacterium]